MPRKTKYPVAGSDHVFVVPDEHQGDPNVPTSIRWKAPTVQQRRVHHALRGEAIADRALFPAYQDVVIEDCVTGVVNYEDDAGNPVTTKEELIEHGEPNVVFVFVEHVHKHGAIDSEEKKDSPPRSGPSTTGNAPGTSGTTQAAPISGPGQNANGEIEKREGEAAALAP
jgi:hypothetical protein